MLALWARVRSMRKQLALAPANACIVGLGTLDAAKTGPRASKTLAFWPENKHAQASGRKLLAFWAEDKHAQATGRSIPATLSEEDAAAS